MLHEFIAVCFWFVEILSAHTSFSEESLSRLEMPKWKCADCGLLNFEKENQCIACFTYRIHRVIQKSKYRKSLLVSGYIRVHCYQNDKTTPKVLHDLCLSFAKDLSVNGLHSEYLEEFIIDQDSKTVQYINGEGSCWRNCYDNWVHSAGCKQTWMLRVIECESIGDLFQMDTGVLFGVHRYDPDIKHWCGGMFGARLNDGHGYWSFNGGQYIFENRHHCDPKKTTTKWGQGDIIEMTLDLTKSKGLLYYKVNGIQQGVLSNTLDVNKNWTLFVALADGTVQFIDP